MDPTLKLIIIIISSYIIGSFPTALLISKLFFGFDIREKGSGNMGSTNVFRVLGWRWGLIVQVLDILKGVFAVIVVANALGSGIIITSGEYFEHITVVRIIAGIAAVGGHIWSIFAGFRGGKGINTATGMLIAIAPIDVSVSIGLFILVVLFSGYISLGSMVAAAGVPMSMFIRYNILGVSIPGYHIIIYFALGLTGLLIFTHRANIKRLVLGTESRFSKFRIFKSKSKSDNI
jgi:glycerol-3-phosphate acyltransferase PlsY